MLDGCRYNILGYADDLTLVAPSARALQILLDITSEIMRDLNLTLNVNKSVYMICKSYHYRNVIIDNTITVNNEPLKRVSDYKYLGVNISNDKSIKLDIKRCSNSFLKQFYSMFRKFNTLNQNILLFLFNKLCTSFYGAELWHSHHGSRTEFHNLEVTYHKALKRVLGVSYYEKNHIVCYYSNTLLFKNFMNTKMISFLFHIRNSNSPCILPIKKFILYKSEFSKNIKTIFKNEYCLENILSNDLDAIKSRVEFVQSRETIEFYI